MARMAAVCLLIIANMPAIHGQSLTVKPDNINLGILGRGWSGEAQWSITNSSTSPVQILEVRSGCNCVEAKAERSILAPGESTTIQAMIRTLSQAGGKSSWRVSVKFAKPGNSTEEPQNLSLLATAELTNDLRIEPTIISFKGSGPGQTQLTIDDQRSPPIRILKTTTNLQSISTRWLETNNTGHQTLLIQKKAGPAARGFVVLETDDPSRPRIEIPLFIEDTVTTTVEVTPTRIQWSESGACRMVLSRPGDLLVRVEKVESPREVSVKIVRGPGPRTTLEFRKMGVPPAGSKATVLFDKKELGKMVIDLDDK